MRILFLSRWYPYPYDNGSKIRIFHLIKSLASRHEVDLISFANEPISDDGLCQMKELCRDVKTVEYRPFHPGEFRSILAALSAFPRSIVATFSSEMQALVESADRETRYDVIIASQLELAPYALGCNAPVKILEEVELTQIYDQYATQHHPLKRFRSRLTWAKYSKFLSNLLQTYDACTVVSEGERGHVRTVYKGQNPIFLVPNGVDTQRNYLGFREPEPDTLVFNGALTYRVNFDAVQYFLDQIFPLILKQRPNVRLFVTGSLKGVPLDQMPVCDQVIYTGFVPDIREVVGKCWLSVVPIRAGGGTRLKILEALALGTPVVSTIKGAEGLHLQPGVDILVSDEPQSFADDVIRLLENPGLREELTENGRAIVEAKYDWNHIGDQLSQLVEELVKDKGLSA